MKPYIDISHDETGQPEYSIHALGKDELADIAAAIQILKYMLSRKIVFQQFNGLDLNTKGENRISQLDALIQSTKNALKQTENER